MKKDIVIYPACFKKYKNTYAVYIPDLDVYTDGDDLYDAIKMARDIVSLSISDFDNMKRKRPNPSSYEQISKKLLKFDNGFKGSYIQMIDADINDYKKIVLDKKVNRKVTIPEYLNDAADKAGIDISVLLTNLLKKQFKYA